MPLPLDVCDPDVATCCDVLIDEATAILAQAQSILYGCHAFDPEEDPTCAAPFESFISWGAPTIVQPDYLAVWLESIAKDVITVQSSKQYLPSVNRVAWVIRYSASGYPTFQKAGENIAVPSIDSLHQQNRVILALATSVYSGMAGLRLGGSCSKVSVERLDPATGGGDVLGTTVGFTMRLTYSRVL